MGVANPSMSKFHLITETGLRPYEALSPFELLDIPAQFDVDLTLVDQHYFDIQSQIHPDRFVAAEEGVRASSQKWSRDVNDAYKILKNPRLRAECLLKLEGISLDVQPDPTLLAEMMEWREEQAEGHDLTVRAQSAMTTTLQLIDSAFKEGELKAVPPLLQRLSYLQKFNEDIA